MFSKTAFPRQPAERLKEMNYKRISLLCGHYGSGKTNVAVNMALDMKKKNPDGRIAIADLDIVNPYFRTKDSSELFEKEDIRLICSPFANTNLDAPALPAEMYAIVDDKTLQCVVDVGGDDAGAVALGRLTPAIREENDYDMFLVINKYRPLTPDAQSVEQIRREIEVASGLKFTAVINNSNLAAGTTAEDVLNSVSFAREVSKLTGLPLAATTADKNLIGELSGKIDDLFPLMLQRRPV